MPSCTILKTIGKYLAKIGQNPNFVASLVKRILEKSWPQSQKTKEEVHLNVQQHNSFKKQRTSSGMWVCVCTICLAIRRTLSHFLDTFFLTLSFILGSPLSMGSFRTDCDHFWIRLWTQNITQSVFFWSAKASLKNGFPTSRSAPLCPFLCLANNTQPISNAFWARFFANHILQLFCLLPNLFCCLTKSGMWLIFGPVLQQKLTGAKLVCLWMNDEHQLFAWWGMRLQSSQ